MSKKKRRETQRHKKAMNMYIKLKIEGNKDVEKQVADTFGVKEKTVRNWKSDFKWDEKYEEKQREANRKALEKLAEEIEKQNIRMIEKAIENLRRAEMNVVGSLDGFFSPKDYETMVKIYLLLTGRATERIETNNQTSLELTEKDKETIEKFSKNIIVDIENAKIEGLEEVGENGENTKN
ncbi:phage terminase small subunit-related protein [Tepidimicrobium xylanilyticum]